MGRRTCRYQRAQSRDVETIMFVHVSCVPDIDLKILQSQPTQGDVKHWVENGCSPDSNGLIRDTNGIIALPKLSFVILIRHYHGILHNSASKVTQTINRLFWIQQCFPNLSWRPPCPAHLYVSLI